jgi:Spy/CpxP family protein refolding chaperone
MRISLHHISVLSLLALVASTAGAQATPASTSAAGSSTADVERQMDSVRQIVRTNRKKIIAGGMDLTTQENQKFWPLYAEYRDSSQKQNDRLTKIILEYAKNYDTLTDPQAVKLMTDYANLDQDRLNLRGAYVKKFASFLPPKKLMRYFQLETKLDAMMNYDLAGSIPLPQ